MDFVIRQIQQPDISGFYQALSKVASEGIYLLTTTPPAYQKMENFVINNINHNHAQYVAISNEQVIGWVDIVPLTRNTMEHVGHLGMGVLSEFRGLGIGTALLQRAIAHAREKNLTRLELEVFSDNQGAIQLYKKCNFEIEGTKRYARLYAGQYQDIVMMAQYNV